MEQHRSNPVCASCHKIMDPIGFSLENFDLDRKVAKHRRRRGDRCRGPARRWHEGDGPAGLREALLARSDVFASTLTEKLMIYAVAAA